MMRTARKCTASKSIASIDLQSAHSALTTFIVGRDPASHLYKVIWTELRIEAAPPCRFSRKFPNESSTVPTIENLCEQDGWLTGQGLRRRRRLFRSRGYEGFFNSLSDGSRYNLTNAMRVEKARSDRCRKITEPAQVRSHGGRASD